MNPRGRSAGKKRGNPRKRRAVSILLVLLIVALISLPLYWLLRPPPEPDPANVLWKQELDGYGGAPTIQPLPRGNVAVFRTGFLAYINSAGDVAKRVAANNTRFNVNLNRLVCDKEGNTYCGSEGDIQSYDLNGELRWTKTISGIEPPAQGWPHLGCSCQVTGNNTVLVTCNNGELIELSINGDELNHLSTDLSPGFCAIPFDLSGTIYISTYDKQHDVFPDTFMAIDKTGKEVWKIQLKGDQIQEMEQLGDLVLVSILDGHITALGADGIAWEYINTESPVVSYRHRYRIDPYLDEVVFIASGSRCAALNPQGEVLWEVTAHNIRDVYAVSPNEQYAIDATWSEPKVAVFRSLVKLNHKLAYKLPEIEVACDLLQIIDGKIVNRWRLPGDVNDIVGPGPDGSMYVSNIELGYLTIYCVKPE